MVFSFFGLSFFVFGVVQNFQTLKEVKGWETFTANVGVSFLFCDVVFRYKYNKLSLFLCSVIVIMEEAKRLESDYNILGEQVKAQCIKKFENYITPLAAILTTTKIY